jgi:chemotaxis protein histidine kinase CheA
LADRNYNRARLEFELSQQPTLIAKLTVPLLDFLQQALTSHRYALQLNAESADVLFNTAQVMITIAEYVTEAGIFSAQADSIALLREALELLSACFTRQEMLIEEQNANSMEAEGGVSVEQQQAPPAEPEASSSRAAEDAESEGEEEGEYVSVQAYITPSDLLDTARSSLTALTLLITLDDPSNVSPLAKMGISLVEDKIPQYLSQIEPEERAQEEPEAALERAQFHAALAVADLKLGTAAANDSLSHLQQAFEPLDTTTNVAVMCTYADSLVELTTTAQNFSPSSAATTCWSTLSKAQDLYAAAVKINDAEAKARKARVYESRGDVELLRFNLATTPAAGLSAAIQKSAPTLIKNAQTYYRGAMNLFRAEGDVEAAAKAEVRGLIAAMLEGKLGGNVEQQVIAALGQKGDAGRAVAMDMLRESLLPEDWDQGVM